MKQQFSSVNNLQKCPNGQAGKRVNGGGTKGIAVLYGSHLSSVIINHLFQDDETEAMWLALANKLYHECLISDLYHSNEIGAFYLKTTIRSGMLNMKQATSESAVHYQDVEECGAKIGCYCSLKKGTEKKCTKS